MKEVIFLLLLALVWIILAVIQDLKTKEIANWLNFSLIILALGFRFFYSLFLEDYVGLRSFSFFYQGLLGLGVFLALGNALYYGRMFAGGDAKLMIALGTVLPFYQSFAENARVFVVFFLIFMFVGASYGLIFSFFLCIKNFKNFKKEFSRQFMKKRKLVFIFMFLGLAISFLAVFSNAFIFLGILLFVFPYFYLYSKSVDEACMVKEVKTSKLTEGDWLYKDVKVNGKIIKAKWDGLEKKEIKRIKENQNKIKIKQGIAFSPVFLISFVILALIYLLGFMEFFLAI